jgi:Flp pilus assembly CpaE family ATPase
MSEFLDQDTTFPGQVPSMIIAPPTEAAVIRRLLQKYKLDDDEDQFYILSLEQKIDESLMDALSESKCQLLIIHQSVDGWSTQAVKAIVDIQGPAAKIVVAFVEETGDYFDRVSDAGAIAFQMPADEEHFASLSAKMAELLAEARQKYSKRALASAEEAREAAAGAKLGPGAKFQQPMAGIRLPTQAIASWSSKGGDGKSLLAMELAWILSNVGGHSVLLVDGDLSRGYIGHALDAPARRFAERFNIVNLAQEYLVSGDLNPAKIEENIYRAPDIHHQGEGNLGILFGIPNQGAAALPAFINDGGKQSHRFVKALLEKASGLYEFVIFDVGTAITIPLHYGILNASSHILVVTTPSRPSIKPTRDAIEAMVENRATSKDRMRLVINKWDPVASITKEEISKYLGIPLFATIDLVDTGEMMLATNEGVFVAAKVWKDPKKNEKLMPVVEGAAALAENFVPGIVQILKKRLRGEKDPRKGIRKWFDV